MTSGALLNVVHLDVFTLEILRKYLIVSLQAVALNLKASVSLVYDGYAIFGVISNDGRNDIEFGVDPCTEGEILEEVAILLKLGEPLNYGLITDLRFGLS